MCQPLKLLQFTRGMCYFQRAILGTEPETIKKGLEVLADAEQTILQYNTQAVSYPQSTHQSDIFPAGTVYDLMHAEIQMMYAITAIMNGNVTNALKALMKMRKAYASMGQMFQLEKTYASNRVTKTEESSPAFSAARRSFDFALADGAPDFGSLTSDPIDLFVCQAIHLMAYLTHYRFTLAYASAMACCNGHFRSFQHLSTKLLLSCPTKVTESLDTV